MASDDEYVINQSLDSILESLPVGSVQKAIANNLYGINFRQTGNPIPRSKNHNGFVFFTRPQLNMSTLNLSNYRGFYNLLSQNRASYQRFTRCVLDPRMGSTGPLDTSPGITSPFVDRYNPFISVLTNNAVTGSGWPDITAPVYTSEAGLYGEEHSMVDGVSNNFEAFDADFVFRNSKGNPLIYMFYIWVKYQTLVSEGILNPYMDMITEREIDYNTRIYRIVLDNQKRYITDIACTGASFPINVPTGNLFDYNSQEPYLTKNGEINIRFKSNGFVAFEDIIKFWFNSVVAIFNPDMKRVFQHDMDGSPFDENVARENTATVYKVPGCRYVKIPFLLNLAADIDGIGNGLLSVNHKAVPFINLHTNELEWWVDERRFQANMQQDFEDELSNSGYGSNDDVIDY
ncbi:hypothetical protein [Flavobacterium sp.]|uniref:hypothetical protein n=1 Tax=Flavobacterium sp. TaxID=239 RepID=UPI0037C09F6C